MLIRLLQTLVYNLVMRYGYFSDIFLIVFFFFFPFLSPVPHAIYFPLILDEL